MVGWRWGVGMEGGVVVFLERHRLVLHLVFVSDPECVTTNGQGGFLRAVTLVGRGDMFRGLDAEQTRFI